MGYQEFNSGQPPAWQVPSPQYYYSCPKKVSQDPSRLGPDATLFSSAGAFEGYTQQGSGDPMVLGTKFPFLHP